MQRRGTLLSVSHYEWSDCELLIAIFGDPVCLHRGLQETSPECGVQFSDMSNCISRDCGIGCDSNQQIFTLLLPSISHLSSYFFRPRLLCRQLRNLRVHYTTFAPTDTDLLAFYSTSTNDIQHLQLPVSLNKALQSLAFIVNLLFAFHIIVNMYTDVV